MNNEEAIKWCRDFQDNIVAVTDKLEDKHTMALKAVNKAIEALEKQETELFEQVRWERDVAIAQLKEIGKALGEDMADIKEALKYQETVKQLEHIYIVPKDSTWVVNGVDIQKVLKMQYLKSLAKMENNGSGKND